MPKPGYINFWIDPNDLEALRALGKRKGYSLSEISRWSLRRTLKYADDVPIRSTDHEVERVSAAAS